MSRLWHAGLGDHRLGVPRDARATMDALMWLWNCEAGHWRNRDLGGRFYGPDEGFQPILASLSDKYPLPVEHGVALAVSDDRQTWRAVRKTEGVWLGIGATDGPPDLWCYEADEPPAGFPTEAGGWTHEVRPKPPEPPETSE